MSLVCEWRLLGVRGHTPSLAAHIRSGPTKEWVSITRSEYYRENRPNMVTVSSPDGGLWRPLSPQRINMPFASSVLSRISTLPPACCHIAVKAGRALD